MIELIVYPKTENPRLINNSPFCSKTEIFLQLSKIPFKVTEFTGNPSKFSNGKLPVIQHQTQFIHDSSLIQKYIEETFNINLDTHLTATEKAQGFAFSKMLEEYFYWSVLHERWFIDSNWVQTRSSYFSNIPAFIRPIITRMIRQNAKKAAIGHGMSRHSDKTILKKGQECIEALANFMNQKKYLLGDKISSFDATSYAFISNALHSPLNPVLKSAMESHKNLMDYDQRMFEVAFGQP